MFSKKNKKQATENFIGLSPNSLNEYVLITRGIIGSKNIKQNSTNHFINIFYNIIIRMKGVILLVT